MQYLTPLPCRSFWNARRSWICFIGGTSFSLGVDSVAARQRVALEIGSVQRRLLGAAARDEVGEVGDQPVEPALALFERREAGPAGDAVAAGAVDRMREDAAAGAIGIVRLVHLVGTKQLRRNGHHQRGLGVVG